MACLFATETAEMLGTSRPVNRPLSLAYDSVNTLFAILLQKII